MTMPRATSPGHGWAVPVIVFVALAYGLAWLVALPLWLTARSGAAIEIDPGVVPIIVQVTGVVMMFTPTVAALVCELIWPRVQPGTGVGPGTGTGAGDVGAVQEGPTEPSARMAFGDRIKALPRALGLWPLTPWKRTLGITAALYVGVWVFFLVQPFVSAALFGFTLDLQHFSYFESMLIEQSGGVANPVPVGVIVLIQILIGPALALMNVLPAAGEEFGWRGWLLPRLLPLGTWPALLLHGLIWGVWHAPLTLLGHNFGLFDMWGVLLMSVACMLMGVILGWSRLVTGSVWPAVFGHAAINGAAGIGLLLASAAHPPNPIVHVGLGVVSWVMMAAIILVGILVVYRRRATARARAV
ncbi:MAG: CPBP family intramembrane metalloprotease [Dermabacter sp.]|nr:CPBP family intramembrane metalloprotease [Dermabacter sp.]